jgi:glycosyltransferase involved in cell wall biosynthesis
MPIKVMGLTQGAVNNPLAASGDNFSIFRAIAPHVQIVDVLDISLHGWKLYLNALLNWHPDRAQWRERFDLNTWAFMQLSHLAEQLLAKRSSEFDIIFQTKTLFSPGYPQSAWPYVIITDNTYALSDRYYRPWAPMGPKEKKRWLEMERLTYLNAQAVFARSHWLRRSLIEDYGLPPEKAVWVGTGSHFRLDTLPKCKDIDDGRTILFIGKEFERKGVPTLLKAFALVYQHYPDARLILVGHDLKTDQPGVQVLGKINDRDHIRELYRQASIFVLPANLEPCGNVITEAMSYRLPCIVSNAGGAADQVIDGVTGYVIPPRDPETLASRIIDLMNSPAKRKEMGEFGLRRVCEELNWDFVAERMMPYLKSFAK